MAANPTRIQAVSRILAVQAGRNPDELVPARPDGLAESFDAHDDRGGYFYRWRDYIGPAAEILAGLDMTPAPMLIWCPECGEQHVDAPDPTPGSTWENPPHRSHACMHCETVFRVADFCTVGVASIATRGKDDTFGAGTIVDVLREPTRYPKE